MNPRFARIAFVASLLVLTSTISLALATPPLLDATGHPKFVNPLPIPGRIDATAPGSFEMEMAETEQQLGLVDPTGQPLTTTVWGYGLVGDGVTYPGPSFVASKEVPITITWHNNLPDYNFPGGPAPHLLPVDPNIHIAHPILGGIPTVTHLHGGHTESASDGLPEAWFTQDFAETGPFWIKADYTYDNDQEAATLWYHDHALGVTRLNVYAGLAGFYLLRDANEISLSTMNVLPHGPYEIEVAVQDRMFAEDGSLFYPSEDPEIEPGFPPLPDGPSILPEFFGDFILVNGAPWPVLSLEPRKYRLRLLNGSDSRFYVFEIRDDMMGGTARTLLQIGTDVGLLPFPVSLDRLLLGPGERADLVVDFSGSPLGAEFYLRNFGPDDPFKGFNPDGSLSDGEGGALDPADPFTTGQVLKFAVNQPLDPEYPDATVTVGTRLRDDINALMQTGPTRQLVLFEGLDGFGRLQPLLGTLATGSKAWFELLTEFPILDDVEIWEIYNATEDAHPIHLHLVAFQLLNRESFVGSVEEEPQVQHDGGVGVGGILENVVLGGDPRGPEPNEEGWKDTAVMLPGEVTRVAARFDRSGRYVWHCHILSHEDHEMMRPYLVVEPGVAVCPRSAGFWKQQACHACEEAPNGRVKFACDVIQTVTLEMDLKSDFLDWSSLEGPDRVEAMCAIVDPEGSIPHRNQAERQFATFLANVCIGELGIPTRNGDFVSLPPGAELGPVCQVTFGVDTIGALLPVVDEELIDLATYSEPFDEDVIGRYTAVIACLDLINNGHPEGVVGFDPEACVADGNDPGIAFGDSGLLPLTLEFLRSLSVGAPEVSSVDLYRPVPNPFSGSVRMAYAVEGIHALPVEIVIFDVHGRRVRTLANRTEEPGTHEVVWEGRDDAGNETAAGIYFYRVAVGDQTVVRRLVHMR
jgi:spore coat protein A